MTDYRTDAPTWRDVMGRLRQVAEDIPGAARVTITMLVCNGEPAQWFSPTIEELEPRRAARQFVEGVSEWRADETK